MKIPSENQRDRILQLTHQFSDPAIWGLMWDRIAKVHELRKRLSGEYECFRALRAKGHSTDDVEHVIRGLERHLEIREADELAMRQELAELENAIREHRPDLLGLLPTVNTNLSRPSDDVLQQFAQRCREIEACLEIKGVDELTGSENSIIQTAREKPGLSGQELADSLRLEYTGSFKTKLSELVKRGYLTSGKKQGYRVVDKSQK